MNNNQTFKLIYVCSGNVFRSVFAEGYTKKLLAERGINNINVFSCGIVADKSFKMPESIKKLYELYQIKQKDIHTHIPTKISEEILADANLILVMDMLQIEFIDKFFPQYRYKTFLLKEYAGFFSQPEIFDPIGQPEAVYLSTAEEIKICVEIVVEKIIYDVLRKEIKNEPS